MNRIQKLIVKRDNLKAQIVAINKLIIEVELQQKRKDQAAVLTRIKASGLLDKSPEELERLINLANIN